jgi:hypothetical protein
MRIINILKQIYRKMLNLNLPSRNWEDIEYFDEDWKNRIELMSSLIDNEESILDLGCGKMWLKSFLKKDVKYFGVDYKKRSNECMVYNLNKYEFPELKTELCFLSGVIEYVKDVDWLFNKIEENCDKIILSYCTTDLSPNIRMRKNLAWVNHLSQKELIEKVESKGYILDNNPMNFKLNTILKFIKKKS